MNKATALARNRITQIIAFVALLYVVVSTTNPNNSPLAVLVIPYFFIFSALYLLLDLATDRLFRTWRKKYKAGILLLWTLLLMFGFMLRSLNQLNFVDGIVLVVVGAVTGFYIARLHIKH